MNDDLISRKALMEGRVENDPVFIAAKCAPAVDPVKHGRWIPKHYGGAWPCGVDRPEYICSVCSDWTMKQEKNYCPNCGAKMDEGKEASTNGD